MYKCWVLPYLNTEAVQILVHPEINIFRENEQQVWNSTHNSHSGNNGRTADSSAIQWEGGHMDKNW